MKPSIVLLALIGSIVGAVITSLLVTEVIIQIASLYHLSTFGLHYYQVYGIVLIYNLVVARKTIKKEEESSEEELENLLSSIWQRIMLSLLAWGLAYLMSLILVR